MAASIVAFDLDGTLFDVREDVDYEDVESVRRGVKPNAQSVALVCELADRGFRIAYVTGRCTHLRALTIHQVRVLARLPPGVLFMQQGWGGYPAMARWKGRTLGDLGAAVYVGDHEADREAARLAGIPFIHVEEFRAGALREPPSERASGAIS